MFHDVWWCVVNDIRKCMDEKTKQELMGNYLIDVAVEVKGKKFLLEEPVAPGFKGVVWKARDEWQTPFALKFAEAKDYEERSYLQEATLAKKLIGYRHFAQCVDADIVELSLSTGPRKFVCFVEEWIDGDTLDVFLKKGRYSSTFLVEFVKMMADALNNLNYLKLCHDDLHARNIKIAPPKPGSLEPYETVVKIIDTGSLKQAPSKKSIDDHQWFVQHIIEIRNAIYGRKYLSKTEKSFLKEIIPLLDKMLDEEPGVALTNPAKIIRQFVATWKECSRSIQEREQKLDDPFYYISAETISSDQLLVNLFAESCPWKNDVKSPDPIVLTGPRGCGKSTIFRRMSLKGMLYKGKDELVDSNIAGFYISCTTDLRNHVNWIKSSSLVRRFRSDLLHYFNLLLSKEIVDTLLIISKREDRDSLFGFSINEEKKFYNFLVEKLAITESDRLRLQGVTPMAHALDLIENEMNRCHEAMVKSLSLSNRTSAAYLSGLTNFLSKYIVYFRERKITFLVDDLSSRQIPEEVQHVFNDVLLERAKNHIFKISSDKYGWAGLDSLRAVGEKTREYKEVDCSKFYLVDATKKEKEKFTEELLAKRLKMSGYHGTPEEIIGKSEYDEGSLGKAIRTRSLQNKPVNDVYFGLETIASLCCGDISVLLEIYRRIFKKGHVDTSSHTCVPPYKQHAAIKSTSREMYDHIRNYRPDGEEMFSIVTYFGKLSNRILRKAKLIRQRDNFVVPQTARIEVDVDPRQPKLGFTNAQKNLMVELVKRAIFIELDPGSARRSSTPSLRLQLRPILCPTFMTTPFKTFPIKWTPEEFRYFLTSPEDKCNQEFKTMSKAGPEEGWPKITDYNKGGAT